MITLIVKGENYTIISKDFEQLLVFLTGKNVVS